MAPKEKAIQLVKSLEKILAERDTYWNVTEDAKETAKAAIDVISDGSEYWQSVKLEIDKLPYYAEDF